jgi:adenosylmethionine-8-amino-7-oxononanoate aminotransferase
MSRGAATFIVEPLILGAGGMLIYPPHVLAEMARICTAHGTLLIADEVMTGWGRTGTFLACEQAGIAPDILCMAKGLTGGAIPLAITLASSAIYDAHYAPDRAKTFYHSSSYTANPIACAAACANLEIWREEPVRERIADLCAAGGRQRCWRRCRASPMCVSVDHSGAGLCGGGRAIFQPATASAGLLPRGGRADPPLGNTAYLMPPYCISVEDLARCHAVLSEAAGLVRSRKGRCEVTPRAPGLSTDERQVVPDHGARPHRAAGP